MITVPMIIVLLICLGAIILFVTELIPIDVTGLMVAVTLMLFGIVTPQEGLSGFSNVGTISVFALLALSIGLESTGAVNYLVNRIESRTIRGEASTITGISLMVGFCSAFLNNTAIVAIMLPVAVRLSNISGISVSKLLMPLSFAAMAGGCITIIGTSTNIIIAGIYADKTGLEFGIFEFSALGLILFFIYLAYMLLLGRHLLPDQGKPKTLIEDYEVEKYLTQVEVMKKSSMIGKSIGADFHPKYGIRIIELIRSDGTVYFPDQTVTIQNGDLINLKTTALSMVELQSKLGLKIKRDVQLDENDLTSEQTVLFEAIIGNNSYLVGKQVKNVDFMNLFNAVPLAVRRSGTALPIKVSEVEFQFGDSILMEARRENLEKFYNSKDFIVLEKVKKPNFRRAHILNSAIIVAAVILLASLGILPLEVAALTGLVVMFITGSVSPKYVYRKMEWKIIFLLAGMIPLGIAVENSGLSDFLVNGVIEYFGELSPTYVISALFAITVLLTSFMSNNATALLLAPIAMSLASKMGVDPKAFLITIMFAASTSFLTPIGYQTNTLIYGPGKYTFKDYLKVGSILTFLFWIAATILIPRLYM